MALDSIPHRLFSRAERQPDRPAYYVKASPGWQKTTWSQYGAQVWSATKSLIALEFKREDTLCILGFNCPNWVIFDLAAMSAGGVPAGIYTTCSPIEVQYIIEHAEAEILLLENEDQWLKVKSQLDKLPRLRHVVMMDDNSNIDDPLVMSWSQFVEAGQDIPDSKVQERLDSLTGDQTATFIYTSGTTGPPKAVMLSHENLSWTAGLAIRMVKFNDEDCTLSYLPLSHIAEQMFTIHASITVGSHVYFAESMERLPENLKDVQPTLFFGVPRVWEKFHDGIRSKLATVTGPKKSLVAWALSVGNKVCAVKNRGGVPGGFLAIQYSLANKLIYSKFKPLVGLGRIRIAISGAAPISPEVLKFFSGLDLIIHEIYGQSEDTGPTTFNSPGNTRYGTVGTALPDVEVKVADDGEIMVKGPNVFQGYYKNPEATAEALNNGWLLTGDLGAFDQDGFLTITGRKKDIIITAGGKNIAPKNIEASLKNLPLVEHAVVIGDRRKYLSALITLSPDGAKAFAEDQGLELAELHKNPATVQAIQEGVNSVNEQFARVEHIRKFRVLPGNFTIEKLELTPTMKVKRRVIHNNYADEIESMYEA